jgi:response regulator RpfG family c-di-GMP phosphodiesterase
MGGINMVNHERILLVDDEPMIRHLLRVKFGNHGYQCEEAGSAVEALDKMKICPCDLIMLDMKMPGKSGIDLLPELKTNYPNTAVIMATAVAETNLIIQCMRLGADDYITKPFNLDEVVLSVEKTLQKLTLEQKIKEYQEHLQQKVEEQTIAIRTLFLGAIEALVFALESKDKYTAGHSRRVTEIALAIGRTMNLSEMDLEDLRWGSLLHDVGKIAVDHSIQNKPGKLTPSEYEHIMVHAQIGSGIVKHVVNESVAAMVEHHHDHYNGAGLHQEVSGEEIPLGARILTVADAFDAMTSDRPYRPSMPVGMALEEIKRCSRTQFDPIVAAAFLKMDLGQFTFVKEREVVMQLLDKSSN